MIQNSRFAIVLARSLLAASLTLPAGSAVAQTMSGATAGKAPALSAGDMSQKPTPTQRPVSKPSKPVAKPADPVSKPVAKPVDPVSKPSKPAAGKGDAVSTKGGALGAASKGDLAAGIKEKAAKAATKGDALGAASKGDLAAGIKEKADKVATKSASKASLDGATKRGAVMQGQGLLAKKTPGATKRPMPRFKFGKKVAVALPKIKPMKKGAFGGHGGGKASAVPELDARGAQTALALLLGIGLLLASRRRGALAAV